jgi:formate dehydrogenase alpha subunit
MTNSLADLEDARCIFVIGSNTTECHPLVARRIMRAKAKGAVLLVADPRRIQLAAIADLAVQPLPGTDIALLNGMMHFILAGGLQDHSYIDERTRGFEDLVGVLDDYAPERVEKITGVPVETIRRMAELYATHRPAALCYAMGITQHASGVDRVKACCNLALMTGNIGVPGGGINPLRGQNNVQGACDMGALPDVLPGYQKVSDGAVREKFATAWGGSLPSEPGLTVSEMIPAILDGRIKALYVIGENPVLSDPDTNHVREALSRLEILLVQDIFLSQTAELAHIVLPAAASAEKDGTFTNTERRCSRVRKAIDPAGEAMPDWQILIRMANSMGGRWDYADSEEVFAEMAGLTPSYSGMSYDRLGLKGLQWPCPSAEHPGTAVLHQGGFAMGKAVFSPVHYRPQSEEPDADYPLVLSTGRMYAHFHTATMTGNSPHLQAEADEGFVEMHPDDAAFLGIGPQDLVRIVSRRGKTETRARITPTVQRGLVFMTFHFPGSPANALTNTVLDPTAKIPELKHCAVRVEKV